MKKILMVVATFVVAFSLISCGNGNKKAESSEQVLGEGIEVVEDSIKVDTVAVSEVDTLTIETQAVEE